MEGCLTSTPIVLPLDIFRAPQLSSLPYRKREVARIFVKLLLAHGQEVEQEQKSKHTGPSPVLWILPQAMAVPVSQIHKAQCIIQEQVLLKGCGSSVWSTIQQTQFGFLPSIILPLSLAFRTQFATILFHWIELKKMCDLILLAPFSPEPKRCLGSYCSSSESSDEADWLSFSGRWIWVCG